MSSNGNRNAGSSSSDGGSSGDNTSLRILVMTFFTYGKLHKFVCNGIFKLVMIAVLLVTNSLVEVVV